MTNTEKRGRSKKAKLIQSRSTINKIQWQKGKKETKQMRRRERDERKSERVGEKGGQKK